MKIKSDRSAVPFETVSEADIREYAYHLYTQSGCQPGHDLDHWLEAKACLGECIPPSQSHLRLHRHTHTAAPASVAKINAA